MKPCSDQASKMGNIHHEQRADFVGNKTKWYGIDLPWISTVTGHDHLGPVAPRQSRDLLVIEALIGLAHAVGDHLEEFAREVDRAAVRQVPAMGEVHAEDRIRSEERRLGKG